MMWVRTNICIQSASYYVHIFIYLHLLKSLCRDFKSMIWDKLQELSCFLIHKRGEPIVLITLKTTVKIKLNNVYSASLVAQW